MNQKVNDLKQSLDDRWLQTCLGSHVWLYPRITVYKFHENKSIIWIQWPFFSELKPKGQWPLDDLPHLLGTCVKLEDHCVQVPWKYCDTVTIYSKVKWPQMTFEPTCVGVTCETYSHVRLTLLRHHYVKIPWKYTKHVETDYFLKLQTKGQWPQDDLWPHTCWGHMCNSTQASFDRFSRNRQEEENTITFRLKCIVIA